MSNHINDLKYRYLFNQVGDVPLKNSDAGWASYQDTQYPDSGTPFTLPANTDTVVPNNSGNVIDTYKPVDIDDFYNSANQLISGRAGDSMDLMAYFKAVPSVTNQWLDVWLDIQGIGEVYRQTFTFPRGSGVERGIMYSLSSLYNLGTWEANGAKLYMRSNASTQIYTINYNFDRTFKG